MHVLSKVAQIWVFDPVPHNEDFVEQIAVIAFDIVVLDHL